MTKIALDVESVLANTNEAVLQSTNKIDREKLLGKWDLSDEMWQIYSGVSDAVWRHDAKSIPPEEPMLDRITEKLAAGNELHVVTARQHVDAEMIWWLNHHNIEYEEFHSPDYPKYEMDYDVFIDDNPRMVGECRLLLRSQPWNTDIEIEEYEHCDRIHSLTETERFI